MGNIAAITAIFTLLISQVIPNSVTVPEGTKFPGTYQLKDLPKNYVAATIKTDSGSFSGLSPYMFAMGGAASDAQSAILFDILSVSYTAGETVKSEGIDYLVTYTPNLYRVARMSPNGKPNIPDIPLDLTYIRKDKIISYGPREDLNPEKLLAPSSAQAPSVGAARATTLSNVKQVSLGMIMYATDYDDIYPGAASTADAQELTFPYMKNAALWDTLNPNGGRILYNTKLANASATAIPMPAETVLVFDEKPWPDGMRCVGFSDGHAKFISDNEFRRLLGEPTPYRSKAPAVKITGPRMFRRTTLPGGLDETAPAPPPPGGGG